ncbi:hypothetical protein TYRP_018844 [Tyrophagus putrescentiae]|nr:hypothetical protein TYRP_018844 [Tyrophagus putrescentiae]
MVNPQPYASVAAYASALNGQSKALITNSPVAKAPNPYLTNLPALAAASSAAAAAAYGAYSAPSPAAMLMNAEQLSSSYGLTSTSSTAPCSVSSPGTNPNKSRLETVVTGSATGIEHRLA